METIELPISYQEQEEGGHQALDSISPQKELSQYSQSLLALIIYFELHYTCIV